MIRPHLTGKGVFPRHPGPGSSPRTKPRCQPAPPLEFHRQARPAV